MKKTLFIVILVTIKSSLCYCQSRIEDLIVGKWTTISHSGDSGVFSFEKNKTMYIETGKMVSGKGEMTTKDGHTIKTLMKYEINSKVKPMQIDFYYFADNFYNPVAKTEGIFEILDDNTIWVALNFKTPSIRPKDFKNKNEAGVLFRANTIADVKDCQKFRTGKYKLVDPIMGTTIIDRTNNSQLETNEKGDKTKLRIEWLDDCSYNLIPEEYFTNNTWSKDTTGLVMTIRIVHTKKKSYIYNSSYNKSRFRFTGELIKIR